VDLANATLHQKQYPDAYPFKWLQIWEAAEHVVEKIARRIQKPSDLRSIADAARQAELSPDTVRGWVRRQKNPLKVKQVGATLHVSLASVLAERDAKRAAENPLGLGNSAGHQTQPAAAKSGSKREPGRSEA